MPNQAKPEEKRYALILSPDLAPLIRDLLDLHYRQRKLMDEVSARCSRGEAPFPSDNEEAMQHFAFAQDEEYIYTTYPTELVERALSATKDAATAMTLLRATPASQSLN